MTRKGQGVVVVVLCVHLGIVSATAATVDVSMSNFAFNPQTVTIKQGDTVRWTNQDPFGHTSTSGTSCSANGNWNSPLLGQGQSFSFTFTNAGTYLYYCVPHCSFMTGTVIVQSGNVPPTVAIASPTNGTVFTSGTNITITASATDSDGSITQVQFIDGFRSLGVVTQAPYAVTVTLPAGAHNLAAKATDNKGAFTISAAVAVTVSAIPITNPVPRFISKGDVTIELQTVLDGLPSPLGMAVPDDGSKRMFVFDQSGIVWVVDGTGKLSTPLLDVSARLVPLGAYDERGLLGLATHPNFSQHPLVYTFTSEPNGPMADFPSMMPDGVTNNCQSVLAEWRIDPNNPNQLDLNSRREILRIDKPEFNHNGGTINFSSDGLLYIGTGDGGAANDVGDGHMPGGNAQDLTMALGKMLRIDVDGTNSANGQYGIPSSNPFAGGAGLPEIYAYGLRNPYKWSFDRLTGQLIAGDVGQNNVEEIDVITAGGNYGWNIKEGTFWFDSTSGNDVTSPTRSVPAGLIDPIAQYGHDEGAAIIGGYSYRGSAITNLAGHYVFGDWGAFNIPSGRLFYLDGTTIRELRIGLEDRGLGLWVKGFGEGPDGELYVFGSRILGPSGNTGKMLKLVPPPAAISVASSSTQGTNLVSSWMGGAGPFVVQAKETLADPVWQNASFTVDRGSSLPISGSSRFLRIYDAAHQPAVPFTAWLSGALEHPAPVATLATGNGTLAVEGNTLSFNISFSGLSATPAAVLVQNELDTTILDLSSYSITPTAGSGACSGMVMLTDAQKSAILGGRAFLNILTPGQPTGEIRGPIAPVLMQIALRASSSMQATGVGLVALVNNQLALQLICQGFSNAPTSVRLRWPSPQANPNGATLDLTSLASNSGLISGTVTLPTDAFAAVSGGLASLEIHIADSDPALTGPLVAQAAGVPFTAVAIGAAELPSVATPATGLALFSLEGSTLHFTFSYAELSAPPTSVGLYVSTGLGKPNLLIADLATNGNWSQNTNGMFSGALNLTPAQCTWVISGQAFLNLTTSNNPSGEIRGQIAPVLMRASLTGAQEQFVPVMTQAYSSALLTLVGNHLGFNLTYAGLTGPATRVQLHGPAGTFAVGQVIKDLTSFSTTPLSQSGTLSGGLELEPTNQVNVASGQTYLNILTTTNTAGEVRGQIGL